MSYDIFDNLNSYLKANDDVDFADEELEAEGGNLNNQVPDPDEIPPPIRRKPGPKGKPKEKPEPPATVTHRKSKRLSSAAMDMTDGDDVDDDDNGGLPSSNSSASLSGTSSSHTSLKTVDLPGDDLSEKLKDMQNQYNLLFNNPFMFKYKHLLRDLNKSYQSVMKRQKTARGRANAKFLNDFMTLQEDLFNACMNFDLLPRPATVSSAQTAGSAVGPAQLTRRQRRQQQVELINLVDSPALILPGTINLDSDEEGITPRNKSADVSFDSENYEVSLKVKWEGKIERFSHRKFQKFGELIDMLAEREGADPSLVILDLDERIIEPDDTPDSIKYRISQFITGRVVRGELAEIFANKKKRNATGGTKPKKPKDANEINLKVQSDRWKKPLEVSIRKDNKMMILIIKCAEELKCQPGDIKLSFDGDPVTMDSTPSDLELEGGEVLDLRFLKG